MEGASGADAAAERLQGAAQMQQALVAVAAVVEEPGSQAGRTGRRAVAGIDAARDAVAGELVADRRDVERRTVGDLDPLAPMFDAGDLLAGRACGLIPKLNNIRGHQFGLGPTLLLFHGIAVPFR